MVYDLKNMNTSHVYNSTLCQGLSEDHNSRLFLATPLGLSLVIGTFVKFKIIQYLQRRSKSTNTTIQVDDLVLFEQKVNLINGGLIFMQLIRILFPSCMKDILGNIGFCFLYMVLATIATIHRALGGCGIAVVRVLCIKLHNVVLHIGAKRLVNLVCAITFLLSLAVSIGISVETVIISPIIMLNFFKDLQPLADAAANIRFKEEALFTRSVIITCIIFNLIEFFCYVIIFVEMYNHQKRQVNLCFANKPKIANKKKRQNTITTVGHFASWAVEMLIFGAIGNVLVANQDNIPCFNWILLVVSLPSINYVIFPSVQAFASPDLREHIFNFEWCREISLCESNDEVEQGEQIELQVIQNGNAHPVP